MWVTNKGLGMTFEFYSETGKIPKGYGYVLKPSTISDALQSAGLDINAHLVRSHGRRLFDAHFWPPNPDVPYERLYMTTGTAGANDLPELRRKAERDALPMLVRWISTILSADPRSPLRREQTSIQLMPVRS